MLTAHLESLAIAGADSLLAHAEAAARRRGLALCFAVVDSAGQLLAFRRMEGAGRISIDVAIGKARTAALFGKPNRMFEEMIDAGKASMLSVPGAVPIGGGLPVLRGGACLGGFGVSGATGAVDDEIASEAVDALSGELGA